MQRLDVRPNTNIPFPELIGRFTEYLLPFAAMWRSYWLRAVAVRNGQEWVLTYFALTGQWSEFAHVEQFCDQGNTLLAVSQPIDEAQARRILTSLNTTQTIDLPHAITATVPNKTENSTPYWQAPVFKQWLEHIADVAEDAKWRYLHAGGSIQWIDDGQVSAFIEYEMQSDLERRSVGSYGAFIASKFSAGQSSSGNQRVGNFVYSLDFPLALEIQQGPVNSATRTRALDVACRPPLALEEMRVTVGNHWSSDAKVLPIEGISSIEDGAAAGVVRIPYQASKVWFTSDLLARTPFFELSLPTAEEEAAQVMGYLYNYGSPDKGLDGWQHDLLREDGAKFELALLNALARLGIPALFAGQLEGGGKSKGQPTPGFDLVALDHIHRRAVAISAKGSSNSPGYKEVQSLVEGVDMLCQILPGWQIHGIIASHAPASRLGTFEGRTDVRVWSAEEVAYLLQVDKQEQIAWMLWITPNATIPPAYWR